MSTATESDDELLASLEPGSFAVFYRLHVEDLVAFFMRRTRNAELAADLTAETFAAALVSRARFDPDRGSASAWLFGIEQARARRAWRGGRAACAPAAGHEADRAHGRGHRSHRRAGIGPAGTCAAGAAQPEQRDAIRAHVIDERPYGEIALLQGTSEEVVRKRVSRGLAAIRKRMGPDA